MRRNTIKFILAIGDYAVMIGALSLMLLLRYEVTDFSDRYDQHIYTFLVIFFLWIITFYVLEMYNINAPFNHRKFWWRCLPILQLRSRLSICSLTWLTLPRGGTWHSSP